MSLDTANAIVDESTELGTIPEVTYRILQMLDDPETTSKDLNEIFKRDQALSSRLLRLSNSAFYGFSRQITSVERAVVLLGFNAVKSLAVSASMAPMFMSDIAVGSFTPARLWTHCVAVASGAKVLAKLLDLGSPEEAFMAGIIHDLGVLMESQNRPMEFAEAIDRMETGEPVLLAEMEAMGATHCEVGRAVAAKWQFPDILVEVLSNHHEPDEAAAPYQDLLRAIQWVDEFSDELDFGFSDRPVDTQANAELAAKLGLSPEAVEQIRDTLPAEVQSVQSVLSI
jgi:HD-like signal output (HDOD) protein